MQLEEIQLDPSCLFIISREIPTLKVVSCCITTALASVHDRLWLFHLLLGVIGTLLTYRCDGGIECNCEIRRPTCLALANWIFPQPQPTTTSFAPINLCSSCATCSHHLYSLSVAGLSWLKWTTSAVDFSAVLWSTGQFHHRPTHSNLLA